MSNQTVNTIAALRRVEFHNIEQFLEQINANFAIIQNSPLYKGIPGNTPEPGLKGDAGKRGSTIIFIDFPNFIRVYGTDLVAESKLDAKWFNDNLLSSELKNKLCQALKVTELINNDLIILSDTSILQYDEVQNTIVDTKKSLNMYKDILTNINSQIDEYIKNRLGGSQKPDESKEFYKVFEPFGKNYANGSTTVDLLTPETLLFPGQIGFPNNVLSEQLKALNLRFVGNDLGVNAKTVHVIGSLRKLYSILEQTIIVGSGTNSIRTLNPNSLPALLINQNSADSGILIGSNVAKTLRQYAGIYVEQDSPEGDNTLVIQSNRYPTSETALRQFWSELRMDRQKLKYNKNLEIEGNTELEGDLYVGKTINTSHYRTGKYTQYSSEPIVAEFGHVSENGLSVLTDRLIRLKHFVSGILETDASGNLQIRGIETAPVNSNQTNTDVTWATSGDNNALVLVHQLKSVISQINRIQTSLNDCITLTRFAQGIDNIRVLQSFVFGNDLINFNNTRAKFSIPLYINELHTGNNPNKVLTTDETGKVVYDYTVEETPSVLTKGIFGTDGNKNRLITSYHLAWVVAQLSSTITETGESVYTKNDFHTNQPSHIGGQELEILKSAKLPYMEQKLKGSAKTTETSGDHLIFDETKIQLKRFKGADKLLGVDEEGNVHVNNEKMTQTFTSIEDGSNLPENGNKILTQNTLRRIFSVIKNELTELKRKYWTKEEFASDSFPIDNVNAKNIRASRGISVDGVFDVGSGRIQTHNELFINDKAIFGNSTSEKAERIPLIAPSGELLPDDADALYLNKSSVKKQIHYDERNRVVEDPTTDLIPEQASQHDPSKSFDDKFNLALHMDDMSMKSLITMKHWKWLLKVLDTIGTRFRNTFNRQQSIDLMYDHVPVGSIILWTYESSKAAGLLNSGKARLPFGWVACDGSVHNGIKTPDMRNQFAATNFDVRSGLKSDGGYEIDQSLLGENQSVGRADWITKGYKLQERNLPSFNFSGETDRAGNHQHTFNPNWESNGYWFDDINYPGRPPYKPNYRTENFVRYFAFREAASAYIMLTNPAHSQYRRDGNFQSVLESSLFYAYMDHSSGTNVENEHFQRHSVLSTVKGSALVPLLGVLEWYTRLVQKSLNTSTGAHTHTFSGVAGNENPERLAKLPVYSVIYIMKIDMRQTTYAKPANPHRDSIEPYENPYILVPNVPYNE